MKKKKILRFTGLMVFSLVIFLGGYLLVKNVVQGKFQAEQPYVEGSAVSMDVGYTRQELSTMERPINGASVKVVPADTVTGGAISGGAISGGAVSDGAIDTTPEPSVTPKSFPEIPVCKGGIETKGDAENPLVVLEVVPDRGLQSLSFYMTGCEPFDVIELGGKLAKEYNKNIKQVMEQNFSSLGFLFDFSFEVWDPTKYDRSVKKEDRQMVSKKVFSVEVDYTKNSGSASYSKDDPAFADVPQRIREDELNWEKVSSGGYTKCSGYLVKVDNSLAGKNYFGVDMWGKTCTTTQNASEGAFCWKFVNEKPQTGTDITVTVTNDSNYINNNRSSIPAGNYFKITDWQVPVNTYKHYKLKNNDILKYSLVYFPTQEEYDDYHIQVITVTPQEINEMLKYDTEKTFDYIERADVFYISDLSKSSDAQSQQGLKFYNKYCTDVPGSDNINDYYGYDGNDLEWEACMKIMLRISEDETLPLLFNSGLIKNVSGYNTHIYQYKDNNNYSQCKSDKGHLNNVAKMFQITSAFDMLLRKEIPNYAVDDEFDVYTGSRTFMEDIYPYIKKIKLTTPNGTAKYTGYYERKLCDHTVDDKDSCYYLWNTYTFYPTSVALGNADSKLRSEYGYLKTFNFNGNDNNQENFTGGNPAVDDINVIGLKVNQTLFTDYYNPIVKKLAEILTPNAKAMGLDIKVKNSIKISTTVGKYFLDLNKKAEYKSGQNIKISVTVKNDNDEEGYVQDIISIKENAVDKDNWINDSDTGNISTTDIKILNAKMGDNTSSSITVPAESSVTFSVEYPISDWLASGARYPQIRFRLVAQRKTSDENKPKTKTTYYKLNFAERPLFNLE